MKKAVLLTLGMVLLSSLIFSLAVLLFHNVQGTESRFAELSLYDRLYDLDSSVQRGFKEIFDRNSYMDVNVTGSVENIVLVTETLPHSSTNNFIDETEAYSDYLKEMYPTDPKITIYENVLSDITGYLPIIIMPQDIKISHNPSFPTGDLEITPTDLTDIINYSVSLTTTQQSVTFTTSFESGTAEKKKLKVSVTTKSGTKEEDTYEVYPDAVNTVDLTFSDGGTPPAYSHVIIKLDSLDGPAHLFVDNEDSLTITHNIEIALNPIAERMVYAQYPDNFFKIDIPGENLEKTGTVRIA